MSLGAAGRARLEQAKQDIVLDDVQAVGMTIIYKRWPQGVDRLAKQERVIEADRRALPAGPTALGRLKSV